MIDPITRYYRTVKDVTGPLIYVTGIKKASFGEMCAIRLTEGEERLGQILKLEGELAVIEVLEGTSGIDSETTTVIPTGDIAKIGVSLEMLGRVFDGVGKPRDGLPPVIPDKYIDINGLPMNPASREKPDYFIQTGISAIDGLNTLVRGQKLPIFSCAGLPANELALQIVRQAKISEEEERFCVILGAMGITSREAFFFMESLAESVAQERTIAFINLAGEPTTERLFTPRIALTVAEYLAFEHDYQVMVILTDMTAYCEALREIAGARDEIPGRRSYPGYMYTDLATLYERAGRIRDRRGSVTIMPILTMPEDDITHPVPDLTGYITEGQIVLSRTLHNKGIYPPIDVLPSLSRLMNLGIGRGKTREDHRKIADQLYASYARGCEIRRIVSIVGMEGLTELDRKYLFFADEFERRFIGQGEKERTIAETLELGLTLLKILPETELVRLR
ncbi:MAG TPA: V-type ATP synthase subunit B [Deltaproteobacteria bacterium]|nr:V-type ATP synthase subunit B [Deltaproteobacteria bacterium]